MQGTFADRIRPQSLDDVVGQEKLVSKDGGILRGFVKEKTLPNMIFYGPSGTGKTTTAEILAKTTEKRLVRLNGTTASVADIKAATEEIGTFLAPSGILLFLDEIQYLNKKQQQSLLEFIEKGNITLIASTTENPYFYVYNALLSRCIVLEFTPVTAKDVERALVRAAGILEDELQKKITPEPEVLSYLALSCGGDVRKALNVLEAAAISGLSAGEERVSLSLADVKILTQKTAMRYDKSADEHYDILSAFHKSLRGSDANAALHYLARLLEAGDIISPSRRMLACVSEDVGLSYPMAAVIVKACVDSAHQLGLPEAQLPLAQAAITIATAPKSNSVALAIGRARADVASGKTGMIPGYLRDAHYKETWIDRGEGYLYPHDFPKNYVKQTYLPESLKDAAYYEPQDNKTERQIKEFLERLKNSENR